MNLAKIGVLAITAFALTTGSPLSSKEPKPATTSLMAEEIADGGGHGGHGGGGHSWGGGGDRSWSGTGGHSWGGVGRGYGWGDGGGFYYGPGRSYGYYYSPYWGGNYWGNGYYYNPYGYYGGDYRWHRDQRGAGVVVGPRGGAVYW